MSTIFDFLTVGAFIAMAAVYFMRANGDQKLMMRLLIPAIGFAVANQLGNHGYSFFAVVLLVGSAAFATYLLRGHKLDGSDRSS